MSANSRPNSLMTPSAMRLCPHRDLGGGVVWGDGIIARDLCRDGFADRGFRINRAAISSDSLLQRAGDTWRRCAAVSHVGEYGFRTLRYYVRASAWGIYVLERWKGDWADIARSRLAEIGSDPFILFYSMQHVAHWPPDAPAVVEYSAPFVTLNYLPQPVDPPP